MSARALTVAIVSASASIALYAQASSQAESTSDLIFKVGGLVRIEPGSERAGSRAQGGADTGEGGDALEYAEKGKLIWDAGTAIKNKNFLEAGYSLAGGSKFTWWAEDAGLHIFD